MQNDLNHYHILEQCSAKDVRVAITTDRDEILVSLIDIETYKDGWIVGNIKTKSGVWSTAATIPVEGIKSVRPASLDEVNG